MEIKLPYLTSDIPSLGGVFKSTCSDFLVDEKPLYPFSGTGQHQIIRIKRENLNTMDVIKQLMNCFNVPETNIGHAGKKDKVSVSTQYFSLDLGRNSNLLETKEKIEAYTKDLTVLEITKHENKLKNGHLLGNNFQVILRDLTNPNKADIEKIIGRINTYGLPNFYGPQRFSTQNVEKGIGLLKGTYKERVHFKKKLFLSSVQSFLFNEWLKKLLEQLGKSKDLGPFEGTPTKKVDGRDILMGPMFGPKMSQGSEKSQHFENSLLQSVELTMDHFKDQKLPGTRREAVIFPEELTYTLDQSNLILSFFLPKGSYATVLVREFMKSGEL